MPRGKNKRDTRGRLQRALDREAAETEQAPPLSPQAAAHGDYRDLAAHGASRHVKINRGGTTVDRWIYGRKPLTEAQQAGIAHAVMLWERAGGEPRTTANLQREVRGVGGYEESDTLKRAQARRDLARIEAYVPSLFWRIFERVVRFNDTAGRSRASLDKDRLAVEVVADRIAREERLIRGLEAA